MLTVMAMRDIAKVVTNQEVAKEAMIVLGDNVSMVGDK